VTEHGFSPLLSKVKNMLHHDHKLLVHINKEYKQLTKSMSSILPYTLDIFTNIFNILSRGGGGTNVCNITEFQWDGCKEDLLLAHRKHSTT